MERAEESFRPVGFVSRAARRTKARALPFVRSTASRASSVVRLKTRRRRLAALVVSFVALASLFVYAKATRTARGAFALADDCPRGALVYAQASDLPALLQLWNGSKLKEKYLASANYRQFASGHVALKLASRLEEFGDSLGFALDASALADASEKRAAVAVYDIGRMELVFVAPVSEEKAMAAQFFQSKDDFDETDLPDGTVYYSRDVEADRGRQKQKILFAFAKGRFVLATAEQLMLRTLANINGRSHSDRLSDEPSFKTLSGEVAPHLASVWVDQTRLNGDYYFKHYWATGDAARLAGIRAGLFDFEMRDGSLLERREFLTKDAARREAAPRVRELRELAASLPKDAAFARVRALGEGAAASLVKDTLLDRLPADVKKRRAGGWTHDDFDESYDADEDYSRSDYTYLGNDYDREINDASDAGGEPDASDRAVAEIGRVLAASHPLAAATAESPLARGGPLFVEFRRASVLALENPDGLDRQALERAIESLVVGRLTVAGDAAGLKWSDGGSGARRWRELELPMLGWKLCYELRGRELFVSNDAAFLSAPRRGGGDALKQQTDAAHAPDDLTLIRLDRRAEAFDRVFETLDAQRAAAYAQSRGANAEQSGDQNGETGSAPSAASVPAASASEEFFSGNVASLLDVASPVTRVEIRRRTTPGRLYVEVELILGKDS
ncbi:MAG TPA: hypothetical protein VFA21_17260 [Pyrinomonadaceae bacterium]|nr:hypothetical protein [Pyrinomonadaceae bacterium]